MKSLMIITYWRYSDALVQTYTLPYLRIIREMLPAGSTIHLVTLETDNYSIVNKIIEPQIHHHTFKLLPFGPAAIFEWRKNLRVLKQLTIQQSITHIHTWCTPAGAIGWLLARRTGLPLILDSFEPHAEAMVETGTWKKSGIAFRILFWLEKKQAKHAAHRIGVVKGMHEYAKLKYNVIDNKMLVKPACIDLTLFDNQLPKSESLVKELGLENKIVCVYAGKFGGLYLTNEVFQFFRIAIEHWGDSFRVLLLTSATQDEIEMLCAAENVNPKHIVARFVPHSQVPSYLRLAAFAFSAFKPVPSRLYCTPIKNGEYWAMGLPVVIPNNISEDSELIASTNSGYVLENLSLEEMKKAVLSIDRLLNSESYIERSNRIRKLAEIHRNFDLARSVYLSIYTT